MKSHLQQQTKHKTSFSIWVKESKNNRTLRHEIKFELIVLSKEELTSVVKVSEYNPRKQGYLSQESLASLRNDIKEKGQIIEPAWGYKEDGFIKLLDGSRRLRCAIMDGHDLKIWVTNSALSSNQIKSITDSFSQQKELSLIERGERYQVWLDDGLFKDQKSIAKAEQVSPTLIASALKAFHIRQSLKVCFKDPTTFGRPLISKLSKLTQEMNSSDNIVAVRDFERRLVDEIDPELIEHELYQKLNRNKNSDDFVLVKPELLNKHILNLILEVFSESELSPDGSSKGTIHTRGKLVMKHVDEGKELNISIKNLSVSRKRFALDVNKAILDSTVDIKSGKMLDERTQELQKAIENSDTLFKQLDSVERKRIALLFSEIISTRRHREGA